MRRGGLGPCKLIPSLIGRLPSLLPPLLVPTRQPSPVAVVAVCFVILLPSLRVGRPNATRLDKLDGIGLSISLLIETSRVVASSSGIVAKRRSSTARPFCLTVGFAAVVARLGLGIGLTRRPFGLEARPIAARRGPPFVTTSSRIAASKAV